METSAAHQRDLEEMERIAARMWAQVGREDCRKGQFPRYTEPSYLEGFLEELRKFPATGPNGEIERPGARSTPFAHGWCDTPHGEAWS